MHPGFRHRLVTAGIAGLIFLSAAPAGAAKTAFRITDLDMRDTHTYIDLLGCRDVTDNAFFGYSFNGQLQTSIQTDTDLDSLLDLSYLIVFDPLDQAGGGGTVAVGRATCTAPAGSTACEPLSAISLVSCAYTNLPAMCLDILPGTVRPYTPAVIVPGAPCFVATLGTFDLDVGWGVPITLSDAYLAATYVGTPAGTLVNGLIRGFIPETVANQTIIPASVALFGGQPLSYLLPGGDPPGTGNTNCAAHSDKDLGPGGVVGWYVYLNFVAAEVPFTELPTAVGTTPHTPLDLAAPMPNPFNPSTTIRYTLAETAPVELGVYDLRGRLVARLAEGERGAGEHTAAWNGRDARGNGVGSGVYFVRLESRGETRVRKIVLLK